MADNNLDHPLVQKYLRHRSVAERHQANAREHQAKAELAQIQMRKAGLKVPIEDHSHESEYVRVPAGTLHKATENAKKPAKKKASKKKTMKKAKKKG